MRIRTALLHIFLFLHATGTAQVPRNPVLISEIMADPSPPAGLPEGEYVELWNRGSQPVQLQGWRLCTTTSVSAPFPPATIPGGGFLLLTGPGSAALFAPFGPLLSLPFFPTLPNAGTTLALLDASGGTVHAVDYTDGWYGDRVKKEGGWSLELQDTGQVCTGRAAWGASREAKGGSPGGANRASNNATGSGPPLLLRTFTLSPVQLVLRFGQALDSGTAAKPGCYSLSPHQGIAAAKPVPPLFQDVALTLAGPLRQGVTYTATAAGLADCKGIPAPRAGPVKAGLPQAAKPGDLVLNEILFHPNPEGSDYVELYNRSGKIVDVGALSLGNRPQFPPGKRLSPDPFFLFPGDYVVITEAPEQLLQAYSLPDRSRVLPVADLPSFPNDRGVVLLWDERGVQLDGLAYAEDWHFPLLSNRQGVALERVHAAASTQDRNNWHSASSASGYGTPGYPNSQAGANGSPAISVTTDVPLFFPEGNGQPDAVQIRYALPQNGYLARVFVFDQHGRLARRLVANELLGTGGSWSWNGRNESGSLLPSGAYIILAELYTVTGQRVPFKRAVVLARRE